MTCTCPIQRYHPAVVAQKAATIQILADGRFTLGLGAGENLNEHFVGGGWPPANIRHQRLSEAIDIIRALLEGGCDSIQGDHFQVDSAKVWDLPDVPEPIGVAVSGPQSCRPADLMIAVDPTTGRRHTNWTLAPSGRPEGRRWTRPGLRRSAWLTP